MTTTPATRAQLIRARAMSELRDLQPAIMSTGRDRPGLALLCGWTAHHGRPVRQQRGDGSTRFITPIQGTAGYPDLTLVHRVTGAIIFAELKTQTGRLDPNQVAWGEALKRNPGVLYQVWRPLDLITNVIDGLLRDPGRVLELAQEQSRQAAA